MQTNLGIEIFTTSIISKNIKARLHEPFTYILIYINVLVNIILNTYEIYIANV